jgi:hypothetical protein
MTENTQPKAETLLEQLHVLDEYLLERSNRVGRHEDGAMAYENSARLLRNILKNQTEPEIEWGVQYLDGNDNLQHWWGFTTDPRLPRVINGVTYEPQIGEDGVIYLTDDPGWVTAVSKRTKPVQTAPWEPIEEISEEVKNAGE